MVTRLPFCTKSVHVIHQCGNKNICLRTDLSVSLFWVKKKRVFFLFSTTTTIAKDNCQGIRRSFILLVCHGGGYATVRMRATITADKYQENHLQNPSHTQVGYKRGQIANYAVWKTKSLNWHVNSTGEHAPLQTSREAKEAQEVFPLKTYNATSWFASNGYN